MRKSFEIDQVLDIKKRKTAYVSLRYFEYVNTLFGILLSQYIENLQITSVELTVQILRVRMSIRRLLADRRRTKINTRSKDVWLLPRYCS